MVVNFPSIPTVIRLDIVQSYNRKWSLLLFFNSGYIQIIFQNAFGLLAKQVELDVDVM